MSNTQELLPCPFCGGEPSMVSEAENRHYVRCLSCDQQFEQASSEYATVAWNRRAALQSAADTPAFQPNGERDYPTEFEAWWGTYQHKNRDHADYSVKKQIAFDAFYFGAKTTAPPPRAAGISPLPPFKAKEE